jgi:hypothetical protein
MPSADKRAAYALEHIAFRLGRIEQSLARITDDSRLAATPNHRHQCDAASAAAG